MCFVLRPNNGENVNYKDALVFFLLSVCWVSSFQKRIMHNSYVHGHFEPSGDINYVEEFSTKQKCGHILYIVYMPTSFGFVDHQFIPGASLVEAYAYCTSAFFFVLFCRSSDVWRHHHKRVSFYVYIGHQTAARPINTNTRCSAFPSLLRSVERACHARFISKDGRLEQPATER